MTKADAGKKPIGTQLKRIAAFRLSRSGNLDYVSKVESPHRTLAIVLPPLHEFGRSIRKAVIEAVEKDGGWQLVELPFHEEQPPAQAGLESLDGLISWIGPGTEWLPRLAASGVPVVSCGSGYDDAEGVSELGTDIASILDLAVEHFASLGLAEVAFFGHWCDYAKTRDQWAESLQQKFRPHSIRLRTLRWEGPHPADDATVLMEERHIAELGQRFRELPTPIGVFCEDDYLAWLFANAVTAAERSVPRDFAVLGTGDMLVGRFSKPSISTIAMPGDKVGKAAFEEIKARVGGAAPSSYRLKADQLIVRESTGGALRDLATERVYRHIERHALRGLTVSELQAIAGCSTKALRRRYREAFGEEPSAHIRRLRLNEAAHLLRSRPDSLREISMRCGFTSQAAFNNYFRRHFGLSPSDFRNRSESTADAARS